MDKPKDLKDLIEKLNAPLPPEAVKQRKGYKGMTLDYLEGWWVKKNANRIFGIENWDSEPVWSDMQHIPLPDYVDKSGEKQKTGFYTVPVRLSVRINDKKVVRSDVGMTQYYGEEGKETALKGCVTDGLKRCFSSFGDQFGLGLYDKDNVGNVSPTAKVKTERLILSQAQLIERFGLNPAQVSPTCPNCGEPTKMRLVLRKDGSGIFWGCPNWKQGCKAIYGIQAVATDGSLVKVVRRTRKKKISPDEKLAMLDKELEEIPEGKMPF